MKIGEEAISNRIHRFTVLIKLLITKSVLLMILKCVIITMLYTLYSSSDSYVFYFVCIIIMPMFANVCLSKQWTFFAIWELYLTHI